MNFLSFKTRFKEAIVTMQIYEGKIKLLIVYLALS